MGSFKVYAGSVVINELMMDFGFGIPHWKDFEFQLEDSSRMNFQFAAICFIVLQA